MRDSQKLIFRRGAGAANGGENAAPLPRYLLIGDPGAAHFKFIGAVAGEDQVGVRIHETGRQHTPLRVDDLGVAGQQRFDLLA